jgi:hypothetical protein
MVSVEFAVPFAGTDTVFALKTARANFGTPPTLRLTLPENPFSEVRLIVYVVVPPALMVWLDGDAEIE